MQKQYREFLHNPSPRLSPMLTSHITWYNYKNLTINKVTLNFYTKLFKPLYSCHQFFHQYFSQSHPTCDSPSFVPSLSWPWFFFFFEEYFPGHIVECPSSLMFSQLRPWIFVEKNKTGGGVPLVHGIKGHVWICPVCSYVNLNPPVNTVSARFTHCKVTIQSC